MAAENVDDAIRLLTAVVDEARAARHRRGYFAAMYRQMTVHVKGGIVGGAFEDGDRMSRMVALFANRYLDALAAYEAGAEPPRAWRAAFEAGERRDRLILQHVVLGINAHVNLDLGVAAAEVVPADQMANLEPDFKLIQRMIGALLDPVQTVIGRFSPFLGLIWHVTDRPDDVVLNFSFKVAREEAWRHALILASQSPEMRPATIDSFDRSASVLAKLVNDPGGLLGGMVVSLVRHTERDDVPAVIDALGEVVPLTPR
ncbi:MAG: DUF5995 family protein [Acidimicrobiales bacterium]